MLPEVAPLCPRSSRERLQHPVSPVSFVRSSASRFMYARVRTSPVRQSWTTHGTRPLESKRISSGSITRAILWTGSPRMCEDAAAMAIKPNELDDVPLFQTLPDDARKKFATWVSEVSVPAGKHLAEEGEYAYDLVIIQGGT